MISKLTATMHILTVLKRIWFLSFLRRLWNATTIFNFKYLQILKWGFTSREDTNYTYDLTEDNIRYLACTLALVLDQEYAVVWKYLEEARTDQYLQNHVTQTIQKSPLGRFADQQALFGRRLGWYVVVRVIKPRIVVETGVDKGLGSVLLCAALLRNRNEGFDGYYYGTDINPKAGYLLDGIYKEIGKILYGDSIESLSKLSVPIDLFVNDSDHSAEYEYQEYHTIQNQLHEGSILLSDNADICISLFRFSQETNRQFLFFKEVPANHWFPGAGIGFSFYSNSHATKSDNVNHEFKKGNYTHLYS